MIQTEIFNVHAQANIHQAFFLKKNLQIHKIFLDSDPEYYFLDKLHESSEGFTNRPVTLRCRVNAKGANVKWFKAGQPVNVSKKYFSKSYHR